MQKNIKKVSVIVPNYNYANYIVERLDSIINQTYPIYELVILDDCSKDNSVEVIEKYISRHKDVNIKFIKNEANSGSVFSQWIKGIENVTGDYFWIAEADDVATPTFLEKVVTGFDDKDVVLSYSEIARINENGKVIDKNARGLSDIFRTGDFDSDFIIDGNTYIKKYLSVLNTILNVSSVVFKNDIDLRIISKAKEYKVAGDWFIYSNLLRDKKIAYFADSLSLQRKHSSSVSTITNKDTEFNEIERIQEMINKWFKPTREIVYKQTIRKNFMYDTLGSANKNKLKNFKRKNIAIVFPYPVMGSGGHRTVIQNANALVKYGHIVDIYVEEDFVSTNEEMKKMIEDYYGKCLADVYVGIKMRKEYDLVFATAWTTAEAVRYLNVPNKAYFIQDFEPWFEPMGNSYIKAENSYRYGFKFVTIGKWLSHKISTEFSQPAKYFDFCADLNVYHKRNDVEKENAICFIYQPEKWRRCADLGENALRIVKKLRPDVKIYLYGSKVEKELDFDAENLHIIPIEKCSEIYNKCKVGLCISSSNPSRIPFEMMACGLPVVELYRENNLYDMPDDAVLLAESNAESLATAILKVLDDEKLQVKMSNAGLKYMANKDLSYGFEQFTDAVMDMLEDNYKTGSVVERVYNKPMVVGDSSLDVIDPKGLPCFYVSPHGKYVRKLVKIKRKFKSLKRKIFRR